MTEEERREMAERVSEWLEVYEVVQQVGQDQGLPVAEAKELARGVVSGLSIGLALMAFIPKGKG